MSSKKRKTKCDKAYPCAPCVTRGEAEACGYEKGIVPTARASTVPLDDFLALQNRLERLESMTTPSTTLPRSTHGELYVADTGRRRAAVQEKAFTAIEGLAAVMDMDSLIQDKDMNPASTSSTTQPKLWPNIVLGTSGARSVKWSRDMLFIFETLPSESQINLIVDFFLAEVQIIRELSSGSLQSDGDRSLLT